MNTVLTHPHQALALDMSLREPLAVLLLATDILRAHSGRLTEDLLREQRESMQRAARQLAGALHLLAGEA